MQWRTAAVAACLVVCLVLIAQVRAAEAGECVVNSNPVAPSTLAFALEAGSGASLPGQLAGVPFSVVSLQQNSITWNGCAENCIYQQNLGETQCGNLVETPIEAFYSAMIAGIPDPPAFSQVMADHFPNGKWTIGGSAFTSTDFHQPGSSAAYSFELGTRDYIDVTSNSENELPVNIGLRARSHLGLAGCPVNGGVFNWFPIHEMRFRVTETSDAFPFTRDLVPTQYYGQFVKAEEVFAVDVRPNSVLTVDLYFEGIGNATGAQDLSGNQCPGGYAFLDFFLHTADGIQVFFSPAEGLTLTPRSGIVYEPVPEPAAGATAVVVALFALRGLNRRR
jgi:hypothetical protein